MAANKQKDNPVSEREFLITTKCYRHYNLKQSFTSAIMLNNHQAVKEFTQAINSYKNKEQSYQASSINAISLIDDIFNYLIYFYLKQNASSLQQLNHELSRLLPTYSSQLSSFVSELSPYEVLNGIQPQLYLSEDEAAEQMLAELVINHLTVINPACQPYNELFYSPLAKKQSNRLLITLFSQLNDINIDEENSLNLINALKKPAQLYPYSLYEQLNYLYKIYGHILPEGLLKRLLRGLDFIKEESKAFSGHFSGGDVNMEALNYGGSYYEAENFTDDNEWMPNVVMMAKNALVWLYQLSQKYDKKLTKLEDIPEAELKLLAERGFNALWLIGLWQRSHASKHIKQLMGNTEAESSAYSLDGYQIADNLGGQPSLDKLRAKANKYGIRLASDMVPNHTAMDSWWVLERPDYFIQTSYIPFPTYTFNGPNLSTKEHLGVYLEDHYYSKSDASVVFKRVDFRTGDTRYIYHGNDGTATPWNDTAQLDFLKPEVREAVIQEILHVARNFSIIRFDAAMVLVKRHIERLWYPQPGRGGDIASRSDFSLTNEEFNRLIPHEFWREVVDRIAVELPETLLLAEAFWMLEGYFVRTLGMHRVYNSAFMNMLMKEENGKYRETITNTLAFDSEIIKRFVNFMSNPDEEPAAEQFGKGRKYFGICAMMATMPGLPMFGHGQLEGWYEKYGMEYSRSYYDEPVDEGFLACHEYEIFPLLRKRYRFSGSEHFRLYNFYSDGHLNHNVFAYSNRSGSECTLVLYNNCGYPTSGTLKESEPFTVKINGEKHHHRQTLGSSLALHNEWSYFVVAQEQRSGLWYIYRSCDIVNNGFFAMLDGYEYQVFWEINELYDSDGMLAVIHSELGGKGCQDFYIFLQERRLAPLYQATGYLVRQQQNILHDLITLFYATSGDAQQAKANLEQMYSEAAAFLGEIKPDSLSYGELIDDFAAFGKAVAQHKTLNEQFSSLNNVALLATLLSFKFAAALYPDKAVIFDDWLMSRRFAGQWQVLGLNYGKLAAIIRALTDFDEVDEDIFLAILHNKPLAAACGVNKFEGVWWFNGEQMSRLLKYWQLANLFKNYVVTKDVTKAMSLTKKSYDKIIKAVESSNYKAEELIKMLKGRVKK